MPVISYRQARAAGASRADLARMLLDGSLHRIRTGWYATPDTPDDIVTAVRCGGTLSCRGALRQHGIWCLPGPVHARVPPRGRVHGSAARIHRLPGSAAAGVDELPTALRTAVSCLPAEEAVCAIDSVLNLGAMTMSRLAGTLDTARGRKLLALADGGAASGLETLARLRLRARRLPVRVQVPIAGVGRVDLIVGDRLVVELDGDAWHSTPVQRETDRRRDSALVGRGYVAMRAGYSRVMDDWAGFEREILAVVRRREHRWRAVHDVGPGDDAAPSRA